MHPYVIADVFTDTPLTGNPLAVLLDGAAIDGTRLQAIAREFNLSETVALLPAEAGGDARLRIFTPAAELPYAGHPTLGAAVVLAGRTGRDVVRLETGAGMVTVELQRAGGRVVSGRMDQPVPTWAAYDDPAALLAALGAPEPALPVQVYTNGPSVACVVVDDVAAVAALRPDMTALAAAFAGSVSFAAPVGNDWQARVFAPNLGVPEDPATGSAAGPLAVHLARHGRIGYGSDVIIRQGAEIGRPSVLTVAVHGSGDRIDRVDVGGGAVVIAEGQLLI